MLKHFRVLCLFVEKRKIYIFHFFIGIGEVVKRVLQTNCECHFDMQVQDSPPLQEGQSCLKTKMTKLKEKSKNLFKRIHECGDVSDG